MIYRISIQENSRGIESEKYALAMSAAEEWLRNDNYACVRPSGDGVPSLWHKEQEETVFNPGRILKAQIHPIKTID